jgi:hypothetical protein
MGTKIVNWIPDLVDIGRELHTRVWVPRLVN